MPIESSQEIVECKITLFLLCVLTFSRSLYLSDFFSRRFCFFCGRPFIVIFFFFFFFFFCVCVCVCVSRGGGGGSSSSSSDRTDRAGNHDFYRLLSILAVFLCQFLKGFNLSRFLSVPFSSVQDDIYRLGKRSIIILSTPSLGSFPTVAFQTMLCIPSLSFPTVAFQTVLCIPSLLSFPTVAFQTVLCIPSLLSFPTVTFQTVLCIPSLLSFPTVAFQTDGALHPEFPHRCLSNRRCSTPRLS